MKNLFKILVLLFVVSACSDEVLFRDSFEETEKGNGIDPKMRTMDEVLEIASNAASMVAADGTENGISRGFGRVVDPRSEVVPIGKNLSRGSGGDALLYVVNYADDNGFAMVSAHKDAPEVLAVTEKGHFSSADDIEIEGFELWLDETVGYLDALSKLPIDSGGLEWSIDTMRPGIRPKTVRDTVWIKKLKNQVSVVWGQNWDTIVPDACEGLGCPNFIAGCAPCAIAMAMSYLEKPSSIQLTYMDDAPVIDLNWTELKKYLSVRDKKLQPFPTSDYPIRTNLARLFSEIGHRMNSDYSKPTSTGADYMETPKLLRKLGLISPSTTWRQGTGVAAYHWMYDKESCITILRGVDSIGYGHQWICDGLLNFKLRERYYESLDGGVTWVLKDTYYSEEYYYIHENWGFHGACNGYYYHVDPNARKKMEIIFTFEKNRMYIPIVK